MLKDSGRHRSESLSFGLQDRSTAALDLLGAVRQGAEELADHLADVGFGPEASVGATSSRTQP